MDFNSKNYWQISEFAKLEGKHYNTVDKWFSALEDKRIHYITRSPNGEKIYDELDLEIYRFINTYRIKKISLDAIFEAIPKTFGDRLRPFPSEENEKGIMDTSQMQQEFLQRVNQEVAKQLASYKEAILQEAKRIAESSAQEKLRLMDPYDEKQKKRERVDEHLLRWKIEKRLRNEAEKEWYKLPESERTRKAGLFKREEDINKKLTFIDKYINDNMEEAILKDFGFKE